jgi:phasin family protein
MTPQPQQFLLEAWKQQLDTTLRFIETMAEGAIKLREKQIEAATDAHADAVATRRSVAAAADAAELFRLQADWTRANAEKCATYWRVLYDIAAQTQGELASGLYAPARASAGQDESKKALLSLIDNACKQWLDATQQFYKLPAIPAPAGAEKRAA